MDTVHPFRVGLNAWLENDQQTSIKIHVQLVNKQVVNGLNPILDISYRVHNWAIIPLSIVVSVVHVSIYCCKSLNVIWKHSGLMES